MMLSKTDAAIRWCFRRNPEYWRSWEFWIGRGICVVLALSYFEIPSEAAMMLKNPATSLAAALAWYIYWELFFVVLKLFLISIVFIVEFARGRSRKKACEGTHDD